MNVRRVRKRQHPSRRVDTSAMAERMKQMVGGNWVAIGIVEPDGNDPHFEITPEDEGEDVLIEVRLKPSDQPLTCRLAAPVGGPNAGIWAIPPVGAEVVVLIPGGEEDDGGIVVGMLSTGSVPDGVEDGGQVVVVVPSGKKVLIHDGSAGDAKELAYKSDVEEVRTKFHAHTHVVTGTLPAGPVAAVANIIIPAQQALPVEGTTTVKAK